jgi:hypothetical protein
MGSVHLSRIFQPSSNPKQLQAQIYLWSHLSSSSQSCADDASDIMAGSFSSTKNGEETCRHSHVSTASRTAQPLLCNPEAVYVFFFDRRGGVCSIVLHGADNQCSIDKSHDPYIL